MRKLLVIVGPTGVGKTKTGLKLAKKFNGEVISADSRQIYKDMDIGTGKEVEELLAGKAQKHSGSWLVEDVRIHLYDILDPSQNFSVAQFQQRAYEIIRSIQKENKLPILVGGTGLYVQAVVEGLKVPKVPPDPKLRAELEDRPLEELVNKLINVDPASANKIDLENPRRIIRALEVFYQTGQSLANMQQKFTPDFDILEVGLVAPREYIYKKLDEQVEKWFELGFIEEVKELLEKGFSEDLTSMTSIGYRQVVAYVKGVLTLEVAKQRIKFERHNYVRRQLSWFKRDKRIFWFDITTTGWEEKLENLALEWYNQN